MNETDKKSTIYLFTSPTCPHCPVAKRELNELIEQREDIIANFIDTTESKGQRLTQKFGIQSVPSYVIQGPATTENIGLVGSQGLTKLNHFVDVSLGLKEIKNKNSAFKKFLAKIGIEVK